MTINMCISNSVRFLLNGMRVEGTDTPDKFDLEEGDRIETHSA